MARGDAPRAEALTLRSGKICGAKAATRRLLNSACRNFIHPITLHCIMLCFSFSFLHRGREMIVLKAPIVAFVYFQPLLKELSRSGAPPRSVQRQQMIKRPENCRPCHSKTNAGTSCTRRGFCPSLRLSVFFPPFFLFPPFALCAFEAVETNLLPLLQPKDTQCSVTGIIKLLQR